MSNRKSNKFTKYMIFLLIAVLLMSTGMEGTSFTTEASAETAPYIQRQNDTLALLAVKFEPNKSYSTSRTDSLTFGRQSSYLVAKLELHERGLNGGYSPTEAALQLEHLSGIGLERMSTDYNNPGPWSWVNNGSPGVMHSVMNLGYILNQWGDQLPEAARDAVISYLSDAAFFTDTEDDYLFNARFNVVVGQVLAGEYLGYDSNLWQSAIQQLDNTYYKTMTNGGIEMNSPIYSAYVFPALMLLTDLEHPTYKQRAQILLDYKLMMHGHLYLPGGGLGAPRHRERAGGGGGNFPDAIHTVYHLLFDDGPLTSLSSSFHMIGAAADYQPPAVIKSLFMDKGEGYKFRAWTHGIHLNRSPDGIYDFDGERVAPWEAMVAPAGDVMLGFNYGSRVTAITVSSGLMAKGELGRFHTLYQYQPAVAGDTTELMRSSGRPILIGGDSNPDDFTNELYDYERMMHGNTYISIWDPTLYFKEDWAVRTHQYTVTRLPRWDQHGGSMEQSSTGWYVGQMGDTYIAYLPLGPIIAEENRTDQHGEHVFLKMDGRSGGITEMATPDQFATLQDYKDNLDSRYLEFNRDPATYSVEFDALDSDSNQLTRVKLDYRPEKRYINGVEKSADELLNHGFIDSPFVKWDADTKQIKVDRIGYPTMIYDIPNGTVTQQNQRNTTGQFSDSPNDDGSEDTGNASIDFENSTPDSISDNMTIYPESIDLGNTDVIYDKTKINKYPPADPVISIDPTTLDAAKVTVTIDYSSDSLIMQYRFGTSGTWETYTEPFTLKENLTVYAKAMDEAGNESNIVSYEITNIEEDVWYSDSSFPNAFKLGTENTGIVSVDFDTTPLYDVIDGVIGYADSSTTISGYADLSAIVRMNQGMHFDAFDSQNPSLYASDATVPYEANRSYHIQMIVDFNTSTYDVFVTPDGGSRVQLADDYAFRAAADDLGQVALRNLTSAIDPQFKIENHQVLGTLYPKNAFTSKYNLGTHHTNIVTSEFDVTPLSDSIDGLTAYSDNAAEVSAYGDLGMIIRMNIDGHFDAMSEKLYKTDAMVEYTANSTYHVKMVADLNTQTYDVFITPESGETTQIANDYIIRASALDPTNVGQLTLQSNYDDAFKLQNHTLSSNGETGDGDGSGSEQPEPISLAFGGDFPDINLIDAQTTGDNGVTAFIIDDERVEIFRVRAREIGEYATFEFNAPKDGVYNVEFQGVGRVYGGEASISINGEIVGEENFRTSSNQVLSFNSLGALQLNEGANRITFTCTALTGNGDPAWGQMYLRYLTLNEVVEE